MSFRAALHNAVTSAVSGAIGLFSPVAAMRYCHGRDALLAYAAAKQDGPHKRYRPKDGAADALIAHDRSIVQARARALVMDNPNVSGAIGKICNNVVYTGLFPQCQLRGADGSFDRPRNSSIEAQFAAWAASIDLVEQQQLAIRHFWQDGGYLLHFYIDKDLLNFGLVPLGVEILDVDRLDRTVHGKLPNGNIALWGQEFSPAGKPVAYHIRRPDVTGNLFILGETQRISADWCRMVMTRQRIGQTQPFSWMASVIMTMHDFSEYQASERIAARLAAAFGIFVKMPATDIGGNGLDGRPMASLAGGAQTDGSVIRPGSFIESGRIDFLPPGGEIEIAKADRPGTTFEPYTRVTLRGASAGLGISAEAFSNDYSGASYSSVRQAVLEERRAYRVQQDILIRKHCAPLWLMWCALRSLFGLGGEESVPVRWQTPGWQWVDPAKDAQASETKLKLGLTTRRDLCAEQGVDFDDVVDGLKEEAVRLREAGLDPEPWDQTQETRSNQDASETP